MKKLLFWLLVVVLSVSMIATFALAGCKTEEAAAVEEEEEAAAVEEEEEAVTNIKFASIFPTEPGRKELWEGFANKFEKEFPQYTIEMVAIPWGEYANQMKILFASDPPDIIWSPGLGELALWVEQGYLEPLNDYLDWDYILDNSSSPGSQKAMEFDGKMYGIVNDICPYGGVFYNTKLWDEAGMTPDDFPTTPDEFINIALKLTDAPNQYGLIWPTMAADSRLLFWAYYTIYGFGGRIVADDGTFAINSPETIEGIKFYKKLIDSGAVPIGMDFTAQRELYYAGKVVMTQEGGYWPAWCVGANPEIEGLVDAFYQPFPTKYNVAEPTGLSISSQSSPEAKKGAVEYLKFYLRPEIQEEWIKVNGSPVTMKYAATEEYKNENSWYQILEEAGPYALPWSVPGYEAQTNEIHDILTNYIGKVMDLDEDPAKAMNDAQKEVEALFVK